MIEVTLYDTECSYGFEFKFEGEDDLKRFLKLNERYTIMED